MSKKRVWMSYDLGLKGDYKSLYRWLDNYQAKECMDNVALFDRDFETKNYEEELRNDLNKNVKIETSDRIYVIIFDKDTQKGEYAQFINGSRKRSPWEGYSVEKSEIKSDL